MLRGGKGGGGSGYRSKLTVCAASFGHRAAVQDLARPPAETRVPLQCDIANRDAKITLRTRICLVSMCSSECVITDS